MPSWTEEELQETIYGYAPTQYVTILVLTLFAISTIAHVGQAIYFRTWWMFATAVLCGLFEILGWGARVWSSVNPFNSTAFSMQISCTIVGPTPLLAALFIIFGRLISDIGPAYNVFPPKWWTIVFLSCDVVALVVQGVGGGIAASAETNEQAEMGGRIMLGGIAFQTFVIGMFTLTVGNFLLRYTLDKPYKARLGSSPHAKMAIPRNLKIMIGAVMFCLTAFVIRTIYRIIELVDGWGGRIITTEVYFNVLDGAMIVLAVYTLNFVHPGHFLNKRRPVADSEEGLGPREISNDANTLASPTPEPKY